MKAESATEKRWEDKRIYWDAEFVFMKLEKKVEKVVKDLIKNLFRFRHLEVYEIDVEAGVSSESRFLEYLRQIIEIECNRIANLYRCKINVETQPIKKRKVYVKFRIERA